MTLRADPFQRFFTARGIANDLGRITRGVDAEALFGNNPTREWVDEVLAGIEERYGNEFDPVVRAIREHARALAQRAFSSAAAVPAAQRMLANSDLIACFPEEKEARELMQQHGCEFVGRADWLACFARIRLPQAPALPSPAEILAGIQEIKEKTGLSSQLIYIPESLEIQDGKGNWRQKPCTIQLFDRVLQSRMQGPNTDAKLNEVNWCSYQDFYNKTTVPAGYYLMPLGLAPNSKGKNWNEQEAQLKALSNNFTTPKAVQLWYSMLMRYMTTGERLHDREFGWCEDETKADPIDKIAAGRRGLLGYFDTDGLNVHNYHPDSRFSSLGRAFLRNSR